MNRKLPVLAALVAALLTVVPAQARTVYRCVREGTVSLATAPEPGSRCEAKELADDVARLPNLWGMNGRQAGAVYSFSLNGTTAYTTRNLPGSTRLMAFAVTPPDSPAHVGLGNVGPVMTSVHAADFRAAAKANGIDDAWLRAIAHAESGMRATAVSPKGAQGIMQLMPQTSLAYRVPDPFSPEQSIRGGAKVLGELLRRYKGDRRLAAAAYNAGTGAVARYKGVPPYAETQAYVEKVETLYLRYGKALALARRTTRG